MPWALVVPLTCWTLWRALREGPRAERWPLWALGVVAGALRAAAPHAPANWYSDALGPEGTAVFVRRADGYARFFRAVSQAITVTPATIFAWSVACSTCAVVIAASALLRRARTDALRPWRVAALVWGALLALDPRLIYLGASDAPHNVALLCFALALWWFGECAHATRWSALLALASSAALVGCTRPEFALSALAVPLMLPPAPARRWGAALAAILGATAVSAWCWLGDDLGVATRPLTAGRFGQWAVGHAPPLVLGAWAVLLVACAWTRRPAFAAPIAGYLLLVAPRLPTDFYRGMLASGARSAGAACRYDALAAPVLLLSVALAAGALAGAGLRVRRRVPAPVTMVVVVALVALFFRRWSSLETDGTGRFPVAPLPYQAEYAFLRDALRAVPRGATVVTVWDDHFPSRRLDPDTGLAWPATLLGYARPDLRFVVTTPDRPIAIAPGQWFFRGAMCSLDPDAAYPDAPAEDIAYLRRMLAQCDALDARVRRTTAASRPRAEGMYWRLRDERATLRLGAL